MKTILERIEEKELGLKLLGPQSPDNHPRVNDVIRKLTYECAMNRAVYEDPASAIDMIDGIEFTSWSKNKQLVMDILSFHQATDEVRKKYDLNFYEVSPLYKLGFVPSGPKEMEWLRTQELVEQGPSQVKPAITPGLDLKRSQVSSGLNLNEKNAEKDLSDIRQSMDLRRF